VGGSSGTAVTGAVPSKSADMPTPAVITAALAMRLASIVFAPSRAPVFGVITRFAYENHPAAQRRLGPAAVFDLGAGRVRLDRLNALLGVGF
jgi:hypothetical protein